MRKPIAHLPLLILFLYMGDAQPMVSNVQAMLDENPILAQMPMFQPVDGGIPKASAKRSSDAVSDNFGPKFQEVNHTFFTLADVEPNEIEYQEFRNAIPGFEEEDEMSNGVGKDLEVPTATNITPFAANDTLFDNTTEEVNRFFENENGVEESDEIDGDGVEDISRSAKSGLPVATFQGSLTPELIPIDQREAERQDENEVVQFNGRYTVSATKYYVDNRVDGEHYEIREKFDKDDDLWENREQDINVDPFAVEKEVRKVARMRGSKIVEFAEPLTIPRGAATVPPLITSNVRMETDHNGREVEVRENTYLGEKSTVRLWNAILHGHDYLENPGAVFDENSTRKQKARGTKLMVSNGRIRSAPSSKQKVISATTKKFVEENSRITEDLSSVCFNSKMNTVVSGILPVEAEKNVSKMHCLLKCAKSLQCHVATFSVSLAICEIYGKVAGKSAEIQNPDYTLHRKIGSHDKRETSWRCARMFVSSQFIGDLEENSVLENSPPYLRLVEKDTTTDASISVSLFRSKSSCNSNYENIFVRSDGVEKSVRHENGVEISEDDCVFACLTNTKPGGGKPQECIAIEYDQRRGICYLLADFPDDVAMTPHAINPVNVYEKICVQKTSSNRCSGGQPIRFRQMVLIGHLVDAHSVKTAEQCIDICIQKRSIGCVSVMYYSKETTLNCILNDSTHLQDSGSFFKESSAIVDYFSIDECLGIREVQRRRSHPQNRARNLERMRRKMFML